jgi:hypothetical protein
LKADYKDPIFDVQRRYRLIPNEDGTTYTQKGDRFGANDINATNKVIKQFTIAARVSASNGYSIFMDGATLP